MKLIYVAFPEVGSLKENIEFTQKMCRHGRSEGHIFFAPRMTYPKLFSDDGPHGRQAGLDMACAILKKSDELWVCGDQIGPEMQIEIDMAKQTGTLTRHFSDEQILGVADPIYAIWAKARKDGPLAGQSGFLCVNRKLLLFPSQSEAKAKIKDICALHLSASPAAEYRCVAYPLEYASDRRMHLETLRELDMCPAFAPGIEIEDENPQSVQSIFGMITPT